MTLSIRWLRNSLAMINVLVKKKIVAVKGVVDARA